MAVASLAEATAMNNAKPSPNPSPSPSPSPSHNHSHTVSESGMYAWLTYRGLRLGQDQFILPQPQSTMIGAASQCGCNL